MRTKAKLAREGILKPSGIVSIIAGSTPVNLYLTTAGRTSIPRKIHIMNRNAVATRVQIGSGLGAAFVQALNDIPCIAGQDLELTEEQIIGVEFSGNITAQATVAGAAPADILVQIEVEELAGPLG